MTKPVIQVRDLSKSYQIRSTTKKRYHSLRDDLMDGIKGLLKGPWQSQQTETFWALKDINFDVNQGDIVGIIGRNGAGKSTLLKILSQIVLPTSGEITIRGRIGSLLEVGTGFHPELTGRENIFMNGAVLGMKRLEISRKFDEIVAFAEVEKFLDTPVKFYSSGMYVRLAFAVAAHLEPEILIVDEVLAVGDAQFQKKCLGKMEDVAEKEGRTVLFVSHNMATIQNLCQRTIYLNQGLLISDNQTQKVISEYLASSMDLSAISLEDRKDRKGDGRIRFTSIQFQNIEGQNISCFYSGQSIRVLLFFKNNTQSKLKSLDIALGIDNQVGERITNLSTDVIGSTIDEVEGDNGYINLEISRLPLTSGRYGFTVFSTIGGVISDWISNAGFFEVESGDFYKTGKLPPLMQGNFLLDYRFYTNYMIISDS